MNDLDLCLEIVSRSCRPLITCQTFNTEYLGKAWFHGTTIGNGLRGIKWSRDWWRHVTSKDKHVTKNGPTLKRYSYIEIFKKEFACFSFHVGLLFYQLFVFQIRRRIAQILTLYQANAATLTLLSKKDKILIKGLQQCKGYNARQFITEFTNKGWTKNSINRLLVKFRTVDRRLGRGRRSAHTDENVDTVESGRQTSEPREISREAGIHRSSVLQIIHKVYFCDAQQLTEAHSMHALFSACSLRDDNVITSKRNWKLKHANSILEPSEYFCQISSKSIHIMSSYTVSKLGSYFETQCR